MSVREPAPRFVFVPLWQPLVALQVAAGMGIGLPVAFATSRTVEGLVLGVTPADSGNYLISAAVLATVACLAAWLPARRAARVNPMEALRCE